MGMTMTEKILAASGVNSDNTTFVGLSTQAAACVPVAIPTTYARTKASRTLARLLPISG